MKSNNTTIGYTLHKRWSAEHVELEFEGTLFNLPVIWQAHIRTLHDYCLDQAGNSGTTVQAQPFIDIRIENNIHCLTVALNLPAIDEAAILRTIIMIRQYKRLQPGRHLYGDIATFRFDTN